MGKIYSYLLKDLFATVARFFLILFLLISVIYFVKISNFTSVMTLTFLDIFQIYFYYVPQIIIYTFPISFFIALTYSLFNFSKEGEMLVLFSLGKSPKKLLNMYLIISFIITVFLVINSLILMPLSEQASKNFLKIKKMESKINVKDSEVGQKVGRWNIFTKKLNNLIYTDLILFSKSSNKEQVILAKKATFTSKNNKINLILEDGNHYLIDKKQIVKTSYKKLKLTNNLHRDELSHKDIIQYWLDAKTNSYRSRWLSIYMLLSLFPFLSVLLAFSIGIINTRIQKRIIPFWIASVIFLYYGMTFKLAASSPLYGAIFIVIVFTLISIVFVKNLILKRY